MKKKWPESYFRDEGNSRWLSFPVTTNILDAVKEKKRLLNEYPESSIEIKKTPKEQQTSNSAEQHYYIMLKLIDSDEAFFIIKENNK